jgi:ATP-dependent DNA helicase RecQ
MALTATADHLTRGTWSSGSAGEARTVSSSFDRPQHPLHHRRKTDPTRQLLRFIRNRACGRGRRYLCQSRKRVEEIAGMLEGRANAMAYHARAGCQRCASSAGPLLREDGW